MESRLSVITLAVDDLGLMRDFYCEKIGWKPVAENADIVFFQLNGFILSIGKKKDLADFIGVNPDGTGFRAFTLGYNVSTKEEVDLLYTQFQNNEVKVLKEPTEAPFGAYFFYFSDPEGNVLEVAYNPFIPLDEKGNTLTHLSIDHL